MLLVKIGMLTQTLILSVLVQSSWLAAVVDNDDEVWEGWSCGAWPCSAAVVGGWGVGTDVRVGAGMAVDDDAKVCSCLTIRGSTATNIISFFYYTPPTSGGGGGIKIIYLWFGNCMSYLWLCWNAIMVTYVLPIFGDYAHACSINE